MRHMCWLCSVGPYRQIHGVFLLDAEGKRSECIMTLFMTRPILKGRVGYPDIEVTCRWLHADHPWLPFQNPCQVSLTLPSAVSLPMQWLLGEKVGTQGIADCILRS